MDGLNNATSAQTDLHAYLCTLSADELAEVKQSHSVEVNADSDYSQFSICGDD